MIMYKKQLIIHIFFFSTSHFGWLASGCVALIWLSYLSHYAGSFMGLPDNLANQAHDHFPSAILLFQSKFNSSCCLASISEMADRSFSSNMNNDLLQVDTVSCLPLSSVPSFIEDVQIFPNPFNSEFFFVHFSDNMYSVHIVDVMGRSCPCVALNCESDRILNLTDWGGMSRHYQSAKRRLSSLDKETIKSEHLRNSLVLLWFRADSNRRHTDFQSDALPAELRNQPFCRHQQIYIYR